MKILLINKFLYPKGGDAVCTLDVGRLLSKKGHEVYFWGMKHPNNPEYPYSQYFVDNIDYHKSLSFKEKIDTSLKILYSFEARNKIERFINEVVKPDIVHLNNFAHQISPSILDVFKKYNIPTVMTMHDYKIVCPSYLMLANRNTCDKCKNNKFFWCFFKRCVKGSFSKSLVNVIEMYFHHGILHIYDNIDIFISPSKFLAKKVKEMGFKKEVFVLPNFVWIEEFQPQYEWEENSICYFGRLSYEKGLFTLIKAVKNLSVKLKIIGDGPIKDKLNSLVDNLSISNMQFLGYKVGNVLYNEVKKSKFVVISSECYENSPRSLIESFALGKPVIGTNIGSIPELVIDNYTGLTFEKFNINDLHYKILFMLKNPEKIIEFGKNARKFVEENNNTEKYYNNLINLYKLAINKRSN
jgi:glycosyltransferase involved in cell wall biosynthesis